MTFSSLISDMLEDFVIVILINLPCFERFHFRQAYSSSVAFISGQCNFLSHITATKTELWWWL